jgi:hypothetical protein
MIIILLIGVPCNPNSNSPESETAMDKWILEKRVIHCINTENRAVVLIQLHKQKILVTMEGEFLRSEKLAIRCSSFVRVD